MAELTLAALREVMRASSPPAHGWTGQISCPRGLACIIRGPRRLSATSPCSDAGAAACTGWCQRSPAATLPRFRAPGCCWSNQAL